MAVETAPATCRQLLWRGRALEVVTLSWNVVGVAVLAVAAWSARSVALAGFGLDSLIEIGASAVVLWELAGGPEGRQRRAMRLIGLAFVALAVYLLAQSTVVLVVGYHPHPSRLGIVWTGVTAGAMFALAAGKAGGDGARQPGAAHRGEGDFRRRRAGHGGAGRPGAQRRPRLVVGRPGCWLRPRVLCRPRGSHRAG